MFGLSFPDYLGSGRLRSDRIRFPPPFSGGSLGHSHDSTHYAHDRSHSFFFPSEIERGVNPFPPPEGTASKASSLAFSFLPSFSENASISLPFGNRFWTPLLRISCSPPLPYSRLNSQEWAGALVLFSFFCVLYQKPSPPKPKKKAQSKTKTPPPPKNPPPPTPPLVTHPQQKKHPPPPPPK